MRMMQHLQSATYFYLEDHYINQLEDDICHTIVKVKTINITTIDMEIESRIWNI